MKVPDSCNEQCWKISLVNRHCLIVLSSEYLQNNLWKPLCWSLSLIFKNIVVSQEIFARCNWNRNNMLNKLFRSLGPVVIIINGLHSFDDLGDPLNTIQTLLLFLKRPECGKKNVAFDSSFVGTALIKRISIYWQRQKMLFVCYFFSVLVVAVVVLVCVLHMFLALLFLNWYFNYFVGLWHVLPNPESL